MKRWDMELMDSIIMDLYKNIFSDKEKLLVTIREEFNDGDNSTEEYENARAELRYELDHLEKAIKKQQLAFENEVITMDEYMERMGELRKDKQNCLNRLSELNRNLSKENNLTTRLDELLSKVQGKLNTIHALSLKEKIELISPVFESIHINRDYSIAEVTFNFF